MSSFPSFKCSIKLSVSLNFNYSQMPTLMYIMAIIEILSSTRDEYKETICQGPAEETQVSTVTVSLWATGTNVRRIREESSLQGWDTAGQERYRTITTAYYRGAMGFLLMYDISNQESFNAVQDWATQIKTYSWDNAQVILVGNKCDLEDNRVIPTEDGKRLADELGLEFFEASAKDNINVKQVFERLVDIICEKMNESLDTNSGMNSTNHKNTALKEASASQSNSCSC
uniref:small monomeric GTPase n=1 Tax=Laticauda laticaudata TaxID=8630 RepID=A0A8C5SD83_LATLA